MSKEVEMIPIAEIHILNPRQRDQKKFEQIVNSIKNLGLKMPIQVSRRAESEGPGPKYDLVCGQGRIEAFLALGYQEIPAFVVEISKEERLIRSLVENIARRYPSPMDLLREIERLRAAGYNNQQISAKLDVSGTTISGLLSLKNAGEERLLHAALAGDIPLWVAIDIAKTESMEMQRELLKGYQSKQLNYLALRKIKRLMDKRRLIGKHRGDGPRNNRPSSDKILATYKRETQKQKLMLKKSRICEARLGFVVTAFNKLVADGHFVTLLRGRGTGDDAEILMDEINPTQKGDTVSTAKQAFRPQTVRLALADILPARLVSEAQKRVGRYDTIVSSIKVVVLVEPLVVHPQKGQPGKYMLVNGHMRLMALKELGHTHADCLIANDDECFTYNARISRLPAIQEHKMITRAVKNGASLERIAEALNISAKLVYASMNLLKGINDEAVELLKDKPISPKALRMLTKVTGDRQVEIAHLMNDANNYHASYVEGLVLGTRKDQLVHPNAAKKKKGMSVEAVARMEQELEQLESGMNAISETYRENMFTLQTAQTYIKSLLNNSRVAKYLGLKHPEINTEFQNIAAADSV